MISCHKYHREHDIPTFGICLGMQMMVVEAARHLAGMTDANSAEFSDTTDFPVIDIMPEQKLIDKKGGTMRLGQYPCHIADDSLALKAYGQNNISERHRHRYEVNNDYRERLEAAGSPLHRPLPRQPPLRNRRNPRQTLVPRNTIPSRTQKPPQPPAPAIQRIHQSRC